MPEKQIRPSWDQYFLEIAQTVSKRATCNRAQHGCVLIDENHQIISTGYNGSPPGEPHCLDVGCKMIDGHCLRCYHAEFNAISYAKGRGLSMRGATAYVTGTPCAKCAADLIVSGVSRVVFTTPYGNSPAMKMFEEAGVEWLCVAEAQENAPPILLNGRFA